MPTGYLSSLFVLASDLTPWSLTAWIPISGQGFPLISEIWPLIEPSFCAAARGASAQTSAARKTTASAQDIILSDARLIEVNAIRLMLYSPVNRFTFTFPLSREAPARHNRAFCTLLSLIWAGFQDLSAARQRSAGKGRDPARPPLQRRAAAAHNCRTRRRLLLRSDSTTMLDAAPPAPLCPSRLFHFSST